MRCFIGYYENVNRDVIHAITINNREYPSGHMQFVMNDSRHSVSFNAFPGNCGICIMSGNPRVLTLFNNRTFLKTFYEYTGYGRILYSYTERQKSQYSEGSHLEISKKIYNAMTELPVLFTSTSVVTGIKSFVCTPPEYLTMEYPTMAGWQECFNDDKSAEEEYGKLFYQHPKYKHIWLPKVKWTPYNA